MEMTDGGGAFAALVLSSSLFFPFSIGFDGRSAFCVGCVMGRYCHHDQSM